MSGHTPANPQKHNPNEWVLAVQASWRGAGYRLTDPRIRVVQRIAAYAVPFSAEQLYADLQQEPNPPGRSTVYRTLEQLCRADWLTRIHSGNADDCYTPRWPGHLHHMVCISCNKVVMFEGCSLDDQLRHLADQTDFAIQGHLLEIYGLCGDFRSGEAAA